MIFLSSAVSVFCGTDETALAGVQDGIPAWLLIGHFEGIDSERGMSSWVADALDSLALRSFLRVGLE